MRAQRCLKQNFLFLTLRELCVSALIYDLPVAAVVAAAADDDDGNMPLCKPQLLLMSRASSDELHNSDDT